MKKVECERCKKDINLKEDLYIVLNTCRGYKIIEEKYFHFQCWKLHFEEKARQKAEIVVKDMQERMIPIAKKVIERLRQ